MAPLLSRFFPNPQGLGSSIDYVWAAALSTHLPPSVVLALSTWMGMCNLVHSAWAVATYLPHSAQAVHAPNTLVVSTHPVQQFVLPAACVVRPKRGCVREVCQFWSVPIIRVFIPSAQIVELVQVQLVCQTCLHARCPPLEQVFTRAIT